MDGAPSLAGTLTASKGHYTWHAIKLSWDDTAAYTFQGRVAVAAKRNLRTGS